MCIYIYREIRYIFIKLSKYLSFRNPFFVWRANHFSEQQRPTNCQGLRFGVLEVLRWWMKITLNMSCWWNFLPLIFQAEADRLGLSAGQHESGGWLLGHAIFHKFLLASHHFHGRETHHPRWCSKHVEIDHEFLGASTAIFSAPEFSRGHGGTNGDANQQKNASTIPLSSHRRCAKNSGLSGCVCCTAASTRGISSAARLSKMLWFPKPIAAKAKPGICSYRPQDDMVSGPRNRWKVLLHGGIQSAPFLTHLRGCKRLPSLQLRSPGSKQLGGHLPDDEKASRTHKSSMVENNRKIVSPT